MFQFFMNFGFENAVGLQVADWIRSLKEQRVSYQCIFNKLVGWLVLEAFLQVLLPDDGQSPPEAFTGCRLRSLVQAPEKTSLIVAFEVILVKIRSNAGDQERKSRHDE